MGAPSPSSPPLHVLAAALREERHFSELLGGYSVELAEAHLVVNEKVPVPRFNFVQDVRCGGGRVAAFVERTLEHYYQRALRPTFEVPLDAPREGVRRALGLAGYDSRGETHLRHLLVWDRTQTPARVLAAGPNGDHELTVEPLEEDELDVFVDLVAESQMRFREEVRRYVEVGMSHPNPGERVVPYVARKRGEPVSFGLFLAHPGASGLFAVGTATSAREQGCASALVAEVLRREGARAADPLCISAEGQAPPRPLLELGFRPWATFEIFELSGSAAKKGY